ncbi:hypothetical protein BG004_006007, partial [Podila humilis]
MPRSRSRSRSESRDRRDRRRDQRSPSRLPSRRDSNDRRRDDRRRDSSHDKESSSKRHSSRRDSDRDRDRDRSSRKSHRDHDYSNDRDRSRDRDNRRESSRRHRDSDSEDDRRGRSSTSKKKSKRDPDESSKKRETSEERAIRKEQRKKEKEEQKKSLEVAMTNYSNSDNPFNDVNLAQKFTWTKKREAEKKKGITSEESKRRDVARKQEARVELEKLVQRRNEREREREEREEELIRMQRATEQAQLGDWQAQEEEFHLRQAKKRAEIRIKSNRAKPIDVLAVNIKLISENAEESDEEDEEDLGLEIDVEEPYAIFENLSLEEVQELFHDIKFYLSLDKDESSQEFWRAMLIVCEDKLSDLDRTRGEQSVVAPHIAQDIANKLAGKSYEQLVLLQGQIQRKLAEGGAIDVDYWEALLKTLIVWKAKAKLNSIHQIVLQKRLEQLKARQLREAEKEKAELAAVLAMQTLEVEGDTANVRRGGIEEEADM